MEGSFLEDLDMRIIELGVCIGPPSMVYTKIAKSLICTFFLQILHEFVIRSPMMHFNRSYPSEEQEPQRSLQQELLSLRQVVHRGPA